MTLYETYQKLIDDTLGYLQEPRGDAFAWNVHAPSQPKQKKAPPPPVPKTEKVRPIHLPPEKSQTQDPIFWFDPPSIPPDSPNEAMGTLFKQIVDEFFLRETVPSDHQAKRIKEGWKEKYATPDVPILHYGKNHLPFLTHIAKAINTCFFPSRTVSVDHLEKEQKWDLFLESPQLKLIIAPDQVIFGAKALLPYYTENPNEKKRFLGQIPLLLLPDLSLYIKDPSLKRSLWNVICQALSPQSS